MSEKQKIMIDIMKTQCDFILKELGKELSVSRRYLEEPFSIGIEIAGRLYQGESTCSILDNMRSRIKKQSFFKRLLNSIF